ncbi:hypothetical protein Tco_1254241 [Tanacetum coccineum]|uniref:Uncharacterized protein n=1 Tax=Tanacetum coccineum TaxID=301880 RepID=A0ABQ5GD22_9ASTR
MCEEEKGARERGKEKGEIGGWEGGEIGRQMEEGIKGGGWGREERVERSSYNRCRQRREGKCVEIIAGGRKEAEDDDEFIKFEEAGGIMKEEERRRRGLRGNAEKEGKGLKGMDEKEKIGQSQEENEGEVEKDGSMEDRSRRNE